MRRIDITPMHLICWLTFPEVDREYGRCSDDASSAEDDQHNACRFVDVQPGKSAEQARCQHEGKRNPKFIPIFHQLCQQLAGSFVDVF